MRTLEVGGSPKHRGEVHGEELRKEIQELVGIRKHLLQKFLPKKEWNEILEISKQQLGFLKNYPELFEEQKAIADAAKVSEEDLLILNNYTDFRDFVNYVPEDADAGCTTFYMKNESSVVAGQTWDMHASATPYVLNLRVEEHGRYTEILTLTGCLALAGVNSKGLGVFINNMHCLEVGIGLSWPALVRVLLRESSAEAAYNSLQGNIPCSGHNYMLCDRNRGINVETTGKRVQKIADVSDTGFFYHTNHYLGSLVEHENLERRSKTTENRYKAMEAFDQKTDIQEHTYESLRTNLLQGEVADVICMEKPAEEHGTMTCGGLIYDFKEERGEGFQGLYADGDIKEIVVS